MKSYKLIVPAMAALTIALSACTPVEQAADEMTEANPDPRAGLSAGLYDAGEAIWNLEHLHGLQSPPGFFDPEALWSRVLADEPEEEVEGEGEIGAESEAESTDAEAEEEASPPPNPISFANTDLAFTGDRVIMGNFHGFNIFEAPRGENPEHVLSVVCPGGQGDVSVHGDLVFFSAEQGRARLDCGAGGVEGESSAERFRGIRIFDISDISAPVQVAAVQTCRGSHTHTLVPHPSDPDMLYIYNSGTGSVRPDTELAGCSDGEPGDNPETSLYSIDVISVPLDAPQNAAIINSPRIFEDPVTGAINGLWTGDPVEEEEEAEAETEGDAEAEDSEAVEGSEAVEDTEAADAEPEATPHGTRATVSCHDIGVYPAFNLAAGACGGNGILLDISDPENPTRIDDLYDPNMAYWHSAVFNNDATKILFSDEWGGGVSARCRAEDPMEWGANVVADITDEGLVQGAYFKIPTIQTDAENCVSHNGSIVPVPGRDIIVQGWYSGGISVIDFTDSNNPYELAFFDRGPIDADQLYLAGYWAAYWHNGRIFAPEIVRGLDIFRLLPSEHLTANEIAAAELINFDQGNTQTQNHIVWPDQPVVARAYLDQLVRSEAITGLLADQINAEIVHWENGDAGSDNSAQLAIDMQMVAETASPADARRLSKLAGLLGR